MQSGTAGITWRAFAQPQPWGDDLRVCAVPLRELLPLRKQRVGECYSDKTDKAIKAKILQEAKAELMRHSLDTIVDGGVSVAPGGSGVVVTGCPGCRKRFQTTNQLMYHLADDVLPEILRRAFETA